MKISVFYHHTANTVIGACVVKEETEINMIRTYFNIEQFINFNLQKINQHWQIVACAISPGYQALTRKVWLLWLWRHFDLVWRHINMEKLSILNKCVIKRTSSVNVFSYIFTTITSSVDIFLYLWRHLGPLSSHINRELYFMFTQLWHNFANHDVI